MSDAIAHRGPDDEGIWIADTGEAGLAFRRLSILDLSAAGHQPMTDASRRCVIVFNGEIYNWRELREELAAGGAVFRSRTDTEVMLHLYLRHGENMLPRLNGMFAFAIWDERDRSLLIARDPMGVKPLYYSESNGRVLFASELKALVRSGAIPLDTSPTAVALYATYLWSPAPHTMLSDAWKLEPGAALLARRGKIVRRWSFEPESFLQSPANHGRSKLEQVLGAAVERQMVADVPVATFLSGGLDSSTVTAMARRIAGRGLEAFTIAGASEELAQEGFADDLLYARRVARHLDVRLNEVKVTTDDVDRYLGWMVHQLDEPQADLAPLNVYWIAAQARHAGFKVLLSGAGGDDVFSGYRRHVAIAHDQLWNLIPSSLRQAVQGAAHRVPRGQPLGRRIGRLLEMAASSQTDRLVGYFRWIRPKQLSAVLTAQMRERVAREFDDVLERAAAEHLATTTPLEAMLALDRRFFLADHNLNYTDKMSMATGVEVRVPLLDLEVVQLGATLPRRLKVRRGRAKYALRELGLRYLPRDVVVRPKVGFGLPVRRWMHGRLRPLMDELLSGASLRHRGFFDAEVVARMRERDRSGADDFSYVLLSLACIELWCRAYLDGAAVPAAPTPTEAAA